MKRGGWERPESWLKNLQECDYLFFTGCDAMITNHDKSLEERFDLDADFIFAADGNGLQSDSWIMRRSPATIEFLEKVLALEGKCNNEQDALSIVLSGHKDYASFCASLPKLYQGARPSDLELRQMLEGSLNKTDVKVKIVSQREINAYPLAIYGGSNEDPESWHPGDFVCHTPGKSLEERIAYMPTLL